MKSEIHFANGLKLNLYSVKKQIKIIDWKLKELQTGDRDKTKKPDKDKKKWKREKNKKQPLIKKN